MLDKKLPNFNSLDAIDGTVQGRFNRVKSVNPYRCRFVATYPNGKEIKGKNLFDTGWVSIPDGLTKLRYELSTGHIIEIPKYRGFLPMIEVSNGLDGSRIFHFIKVHCLADNEVVVYKIVLREDNINLSPYKIGDIIMSKQPIPKDRSSSWRYTS